MKNLLYALRPLALDMASTIFFVVLWSLTHNLILATAVGIGVVALTDDPWTFDALRFEALATETRVRAKVDRKPCPSEVVFALDSAVGAPAQHAPAEWRGLRGGSSRRRAAPPVREGRAATATR